MMKMKRFGGCAYWDGLAWRCSTCNGLTTLKSGLDVCGTCYDYGLHDEAERRQATVAGRRQAVN